MPHIKAYHRPQTIEEALELLARSGVNSVIIGGGTHAVARLSDLVDEVIDLQALNLTNINFTGQGVTVGALVTLQTIVEDERFPWQVRQSAHFEGANTFRNMATIGGIIAGPNRESELLATLLVFDAQVTIRGSAHNKTLPLPDVLRDVPAALGGGLITGVSMATIGQTASDRVARTPADRPIVAAVVRKDQNGTIRLALCGADKMPVLVDAGNVKAAVNPMGDFRGSTEYRRQMAATLSRRVLSLIED